jgi:hypothetical protein
VSNTLPTKSVYEVILLTLFWLQKVALAGIEEKFNYKDEKFFSMAGRQTGRNFFSYKVKIQQLQDCFHSLLKVGNILNGV